MESLHSRRHIFVLTSRQFQVIFMLIALVYFLVSGISFILLEEKADFNDLFGGRVILQLLMWGTLFSAFAVIRIFLNAWGSDETECTALTLCVALFMFSRAFSTLTQAGSASLAAGSIISFFLTGFTLTKLYFISCASWMIALVSCIIQRHNVMMCSVELFPLLLFPIASWCIYDMVYTFAKKLKAIDASPLDNMTLLNPYLIKAQLAAWEFRRTIDIGVISKHLRNILLDGTTPWRYTYNHKTTFCTYWNWQEEAERLKKMKEEAFSALKYTSEKEEESQKDFMRYSSMRRKYGSSSGRRLTAASSLKNKDKVESSLTSTCKHSDFESFACGKGYDEGYSQRNSQALPRFATSSKLYDNLTHTHRTHLWEGGASFDDNIFEDTLAENRGLDTCESAFQKTAFHTAAPVRHQSTLGDSEGQERPLRRYSRRLSTLKSFKRFLYSRVSASDSFRQNSFQAKKAASHQISRIFSSLKMTLLEFLDISGDKWRTIEISSLILRDCFPHMYLKVLRDEETERWFLSWRAEVAMWYYKESIPRNIYLSCLNCVYVFFWEIWVSSEVLKRNDIPGGLINFMFAPQWDQSVPIVVIIIFRPLLQLLIDLGGLAMIKRISATNLENTWKFHTLVICLGISRIGFALIDLTMMTGSFASYRGAPIRPIDLIQEGYDLQLIATLLIPLMMNLTQTHTGPGPFAALLHVTVIIYFVALGILESPLNLKLAYMAGYCYLILLSLILCFTLASWSIDIAFRQVFCDYILPYILYLHILSDSERVKWLRNLELSENACEEGNE